MVNVDGISIRVRTLGLADRADGEPVLFLQSGAGSPLEAWGTWISQISDLAPVVAFDRPGIGKSKFDDMEPTPEREATDAHEVMRVLGVPPPYILIGHSWGGPLILYYAGDYPDEVVGMVYLDPTEASVTAYDYLGASNADEYAVRLSQYTRAISAVDTMALPPGVKAEQHYILKFLQTPPEDRHVPKDPEVPTAVVLGTLFQPANQAGLPFMNETVWEDLVSQRLARYTKWLRGRPNTTLIVATDAGHFVHRFDPALAKEAVRRVVAAVRAKH